MFYLTYIETVFLCESKVFNFIKSIFLTNPDLISTQKYYL